MKIFLDALSRVPTVSVGTQALIIGSLQIIRKRFPEATFVMLSGLPSHERSYLDATGYPIEYVQRSSSPWVTMRQWHQIAGSVDAVASAWGDGYVTTPSHLLLLKAACLKRSSVPNMLVTASLGPFRGALDRVFARWGLSTFDRLTVRDVNTQRYVESLGLRDVRCLPDTAFVLEPTAAPAVNAILEREGVPLGTPCIGVNPSILLHHRFAHLGERTYVSVMVSLLDHLRKTIGVPIMLIPHQIYPANFPGLTDEIRYCRDGDDRAAAQLILAGLTDTSGIYPITGDYSPAEYKGIIQHCDLFIGGRMHSVIGSVSALVPSVILQYSHKASGVMKMLKLDDYLWDIQSSPDDLLRIVDGAWEHRAEQRAALTSIMPGFIARAYEVGDVFAEAIAAK